MDDSTFSQFSPDGLTAADVDVMLAEVADVLAEMPSATSALVDGSARERRDRRAVQRRLSNAVHARHAARCGRFASAWTALDEVA